MIDTRILNFTGGLIAVWLIVNILVVGKSILIPLVTAIVIWYLLIRLVHAFSQIPFTHRQLPNSLAILFASLTTGYIIYLFVNLVSSSLNGIIRQAPLYQEKIQKIVLWINAQSDGRVDVHRVLSSIDMNQFFSDIAVTLTNVAGNLGIIAVYVVFLLLEYETFDAKLKAITSNAASLNTSREIIDRVITDVNAYMKIKTLLSLATAILCYIVLYAFGVSYPQFWALVIFIFNFIPTIGAVISLAVTLLAVSIHFTAFASFLIMAALLIGIHFIIGSIIEPRFMGKNLNLSPLVILLSLAFWGHIWGVLGMFLCVPLMTIIN
ncbi:MAG: AI-2E family transporter, partial [Pseudomonadota bacterium]|nr:AI-2E family transporter [Pseudomonadota bacterium]